jgi:hypothetical protein
LRKKKKRAEWTSNNDAVINRRALPDQRGEAARMSKRALLAASLCAGWALAGIGIAHAQSYPNRLIKMIVPFPAGGPTDGMARIISAPRWSRRQIPTATRS